MEINIIVGTNIKKIRDDKGLSLDKLSVLTDVSKSMLGQIERGESSPSINILSKIANGLKVDLVSLTVKKSEATELFKIKKPTIKDTGKVQIFSVFPFELNNKFEMQRIEMESQGEFVENSHIKGSEVYIVVFNGTLTISVSGKSFLINKGESFRFQSDQQHKYSNETLIGCEFSCTRLFNN